MIQALTLLFFCQLLGEVAVRALGLSFPGPVLGMALLATLLLIRGRSSADLDLVADGILKNLALLFVPAAVGIIQQADLIVQHWLAIGAALIISTILTLIVTVYTFQFVAARLTTEG